MADLLRSKKSSTDVAADAGAADVLVRLTRISKVYNGNGGPIVVLKDLSCDIAVGETIAVVGESGIGKSTFLHVLGTLDRPDSGRIYYRGEDVFGFDSKSLARFRNKSIGFVFQFHYLLAEFTALENTMMPGLIRGDRPSAIREKAEAILVRVGLKERIRHRVNQLSGGEQQRVALARALVLDPAILLADEPTGNLDQKNSAQVHDLLLSLNQERHMTIVTVTHNMKLAACMERIMTLADGKLLELDKV